MITLVFLKNVSRLGQKQKQLQHQGRKISLTTDKMSKKLPTTDRKNINRLPTWADIINICFQKKEHFAFFFPVDLHRSKPLIS